LKRRSVASGPGVAVAFAGEFHSKVKTGVSGLNADQARKRSTDDPSRHGQLPPNQLMDSNACRCKFNASRLLGFTA
jgi:hypothetical protein